MVSIGIIKEEKARVLTYRFLHRFLGKSGFAVEMGDTKLSSAAAVRVLTEDMELVTGASLLLLYQVDFAVEGRHILFYREYYNSKFYASR